MATLVSEMPTPAPVAHPASAGIMTCARLAQGAWSRKPVRERLAVITKARHLIAANCRELAASVRLDTRRNLADTLVAEVLPLAEACRFLEREAVSILRPTKHGRKGRPFWLSGVEAEVHRVPLGVALNIAPSNYPLFLPGVQCVQALAAGNAVLWKPAPAGTPAARAFARILALAGLPNGLLQILDESAEAAVDAIYAGADKVFLTGHENTGRSVMHELAERVTPSVMELSGCDAVFVLPGADLDRVACALAFGMRLNGSATCMAPRRVFATVNDTQELLALLKPMLAKLERVPLHARARGLLDALLQDARKRGGEIALDGRSGDSDEVRPTLVIKTPPDAQILQTDIFAPLLTFCAVRDTDAALEANALCPYALTAAIFGPEEEARKLGDRLRAGTVLINDLIVSTADPRVPFGGRGASGFGATRGREGLLEMTAVKTILTQKKRSLRPYAATNHKHEMFFASYIEAAHAASWSARLKGLRRLLDAAKDVEK
jgi:aldehyde dehydrogenase (NAD+)